MSDCFFCAVNSGVLCLGCLAGSLFRSVCSGRGGFVCSANFADWDSRCGGPARGQPLRCN
jgi:hypothetical protein